jgi:hypothetical protein
MVNPSSVSTGVLSEDDLLERVKKIAQYLPKIAHASQKLVHAREAVLGLEISQQKFLRWRDMWNADSQESRASSQTLWGRSGWEKVRKLLESITKSCEKIDAEISRNSGVARTPQAGQRTAVSMWKWLFSRVRSGQVAAPEYNGLKDLVTTLSRQVDELWALSESSFETRHGVFGQVIEQTETSALLSAARTMRNGSIALYRACRTWNLDVYLSVNVLGRKGNNDGLLDMQEFGTRKLFYHLFIRPHDESGALEELVLESLDTKKPMNINSSDIIDSSSVEWPQMDSNLRSSKARLIAAKNTFSRDRDTHYFNILTPLRRLVLENEPEGLESLAQRLEKPQAAARGSGGLGRFSTAEGVELAYNIARCSFFLLGTPWLANLSSKTLRLVKATGPKRKHDVLQIRTADMEDLMDDQPVLLAVPQQLRQIGILLAEIAFGGTTSPSDKKDEELYKEPSKVLPMVERLMGVQYYKATAFCMKDWGAEPHFRASRRRDVNDDRGDDRGWKSYVTKFLEEYYLEVVRRYGFLSFSDHSSGADMI